MIIWILIFILLALLGTPLFIIISAIALLAFHSIEIDSSAIMIEMYRMASAPTLLAIPLFTFTGYLLAESNAPKRLMNLNRALFGHLAGGTSIIVLVSCAFFTAFTGASGVTIIALGGLLFPILLKEKYPNKRIGFTCSCFDILHCGHIVMLKDAKSQCDNLGLNFKYIFENSISSASQLSYSKLAV